MVYSGPNSNNVPVSDPLVAHRFVRESGCPNFRGRCIPVDSKLNIQNLRYYLANFLDKQLLDLLKFDFALDFDRNGPLTSTEENHASATNFANDVCTYIGKELKYGTILGPFKDKPIDLHVSQFMTRDRPDSNVR